MRQDFMIAKSIKYKTIKLLYMNRVKLLLLISILISLELFHIGYCKADVHEIRYGRSGHDQEMRMVRQTVIVKGDTLLIVSKTMHSNITDTIAVCKISKESDNFICLNSINYIDAVFQDSLKIYHPRITQDSTIIDFNFPNLDRPIKLTVQYRYRNNESTLSSKVMEESFSLDQNNKEFRFSSDRDIAWFWTYITPNSFVADNVGGGYYGLVYYPSTISLAIDLFNNDLYIELPSIGKKLFNKWYMYYDYARLTDSVFEWHNMKFNRIVDDEDLPAGIDINI